MKRQRTENNDQVDFLTDILLILIYLGLTVYISVGSMLGSGVQTGSGWEVITEVTFGCTMLLLLAASRVYLIANDMKERKPHVASKLEGAPQNASN
jgi:hypothetical protein